MKFFLGFGVGLLTVCVVLTTVMYFSPDLRLPDLSGSNKDLKLAMVPAAFGLPDSAVVHYLGRINRKIYYLVYSLNPLGENYGYQVFIGPPKKMKRAKVTSAYFLRDGGTAIIETEQGEFYFPSPFKQEQPTFQKKKITELGRSRFTPAYGFD